MTRIVALFSVLFVLTQLVLMEAPAVAQVGGNSYQSARTVTVESWVEEWDPAAGRWIRVAQGQAEAGAFEETIPTITTAIVNQQVVAETRTYPRTEAQSAPRLSARFARPVAIRDLAHRSAQYGPFIVTSATHAAVVGPTDSDAPRHFDAMLRDFPQLATLEMIEAPGTTNDLANLEVGRMIRAAGIATHVPQGGSVRSGAVELFLAGITRTLEDGAQFAVHSWLDNYGREADDFDPDHPAHRLYLDYYVEMGMSDARARAFYDMTNSVPHASALWLKAHEMRPWLAPETPRMRIAAREFTPEIAPEIASETDSHDAVVPLLAYSNLNAISIARLDLSRLDSRAAFP